MGLGLAELARARNAVEVIRVAQNSMLDGYVIRLQVSKRNSRDVAEEVRRMKRSNF